MTCYHVDLKGGGSAIICVRDRRHACSARHPEIRTYCGREAHYQCDFPVGKPGRTCSRYICKAHAHEIGEDRHLCPEHLKLWAEQQRQGALPL